MTHRPNTGGLASISHVLLKHPCPLAYVWSITVSVLQPQSCYRRIAKPDILLTGPVQKSLPILALNKT